MFDDMSQYVACHSHTFRVDSSARNFGVSSWPGSISLWHWTVPWQQVTEKSVVCLFFILPVSPEIGLAFPVLGLLISPFLEVFNLLEARRKTLVRHICISRVLWIELIHVLVKLSPPWHEVLPAAVSLSHWKTSENRIVLFEFHMSRALQIAEEFHVYSTRYSILSETHRKL